MNAATKRNTMNLNDRTASAMKRTRERMGVNVATLASEMGISADTLYRLEGGRTTITINHVDAASKPLGYTPEGLLRELARDCNE